MIREKQFVLSGKSNKPIVLDVSFEPTQTPKPIVIFCHGYKGFKDWGAWNLVAERFAYHGFFFIKFNFSHNGGTPEQPIDFPDLDAFSQDNFSKQLDDLESVIEWILTTKEYLNEADVQNLNLIGHSRGGAIALIKAAENNQVNKIATWAAVSTFDRAFPKDDQLKEWKEKGVYYVQNSRTKQRMPHAYQFYEDYQANQERFDLKKATRHLRKPHLIVHAKDDETVNKKAADKLSYWSAKNKIYLLTSGGHTFGAKHPWMEDQLPTPLRKVADKTINFFKR